MLELLKIHNLAIIDDLEIEFGAGLNIITGETGAGKSILLKALGLLLGERAQTADIRTGADKALLQAEFDCQTDERISSFLAESDLDLPEDGRLLIQREIQRAGKSRCRIGDRLVTLQTLAQLGDMLVDFHGQHEHQSLLRADEHLALVDAYGKQHGGLLQKYQVCWEQFSEARRALSELQGRLDDRERQLDLLRYELEEIEKAGVEVGELDQLKTERQRLGNAEKIRHQAASALALLDDADERSLPNQMGRLQKEVGRLLELDSSLGELENQCHEASLLINDLSHRLLDYLESVAADPERFNEVQERLEQLDRLCRKYGPNEEEILRVADEHRAHLDSIEQSDARHAELTQQVEKLSMELNGLADKLTRAREKTGKQLTRALEKELKELKMEGAVLSIRRKELSAPGPNGLDHLEFLLAANVGQEAQQLRRVASGGELSRIMLALKTVDARERRLPTMVFDEIDAGIGGDTANRVGAKLASLADRQQVLCITHLPQIAALGRQHLSVNKKQRGKRTLTVVERLDGKHREEELARMIGGDKLLKENLAAARAMLVIK
jgi:DNA repair protein RecN (Recombination protein N)